MARRAPIIAVSTRQHRRVAMLPGKAVTPLSVQMSERLLRTKPKARLLLGTLSPALPTALPLLRIFLTLLQGSR